MKQVFTFLTCMALGGFLVPAAAAAAPIATVVEVSGPVEITVGGTRGTLAAGARIEEGSVIETANNGQVQLTFDDGTNMVITERSRLEITSVLMSGSSSASRFVVNAVSGGFRFMSGASDPGAYEITTPTATLGIRGTAFDIAVDSRNTALALFDGEVAMCARSQRCFAVRGACAVAQTVGAERVEGLTGREAGQLLADAFPLVGQQGSLRREFRVDDDSCDRYTVIIDGAGPQPSSPAPDRTEFTRPGFDGEVFDRPGN